ncbi:MAG TPA: SMC-Scp complex subunit ScpB [Opitutaceae bacterium]
MNPSPEVSLERDESRLPPRIEAVVLASPEPVTVRDLARALRADELEVQLAIDGLNADYARPEHGIFLRYARGGYQIATKPELSEDLRDLLLGVRPPAPLSMAALQTLAIVAYKQPVSAPEIHAIRRVEAPGVLRTLLKRKLIAPAGHNDDAGHARLYKTTRQFLIDFGLKDLKELPALEEFAELRERYERNLSSPTGVPPG